MFDFLYLHTYDAASILEDGDESCAGFELVLHAKIYALGGKYDIPSLKTAALDHFEAGGKSHWRDHVFFEAIRVVFTTIPDSDSDLRKTATGIILGHNTFLARQPRWMTQSGP